MPTGILHLFGVIFILAGLISSIIILISAFQMMSGKDVSASFACSTGSTTRSLNSSTSISG